MLDKSKEINAQKVYDNLVKLGKLNHKPLFDVYLAENPKNPKQWILRLQQPRWFLNTNKYQTIRQAYETLITKIVKNMNPNFDQTLVMRMVQLEEDFAKVFLIFYFRVHVYTRTPFYKSIL